MYKEQRDVLEEEMREIDDWEMEEFGTLDSSEKTIAILGDSSRRRQSRKGIRLAKRFYVVRVHGTNAMSAQMLEVSLSGVGTVLRLEGDA